MNCFERQKEIIILRYLMFYFSRNEENLKTEADVFLAEEIEIYLYRKETKHLLKRFLFFNSKF